MKSGLMGSSTNRFPGTKRSMSASLVKFSKRRYPGSERVSIKLQGKYYKDGKYWISEIPFIYLMDQGKTKSESLKMIRSSVEELMTNSGFECQIEDKGDGEFVLSSENVKLLTCFVLRRLREAQGLSIREVSALLKHKSHTEYARHEAGTTAMTLETFNRYIEALTDKELVIQIA